MFGSRSLSTWPNKAKRQLWDQLPGNYEIRRDTHHPMFIEGQRFTQADINPYVWGGSVITRRAPTDPAYQSELLQHSTFSFATNNGDIADAQEAHVFRLQDGEWSIWKVGDYAVVTEKITDLTLKELMPPHATLKSVQKRWKDERGVAKYLGLKFVMREELCWTMYHRVECQGEETVQGTEYRKIPEDRREGWLEWLAKGAKIGFQGMKGYLGAEPWILAGI